jgi:hypothetical protein
MAIAAAGARLQTLGTAATVCSARLQRFVKTGKYQPCPGHNRLQSCARNLADRKR